MKSELAEKLLATVMGWKTDEVGHRLRDLLALAALKYDGYGQYRPGVRFIETLASWLEQFEQDERDSAIDFVLSDLIFISRSELSHIIEIVYPDLIRPLLIQESAKRTGRPTHLVNEIAASLEHRALERATLLLGLSDGARLDDLRRACPGLSHEQFYLVPDPELPRFEAMAEKLKKAQALHGFPETGRFAYVLLVDDFSGSGYTLLHRDATSEFGGKLVRAKERFDRLVQDELLEEDYGVAIVLYVASSAAEETLRANLRSAGLERWDLRVLQSIPETLCPAEDSRIAEISKAYYDQKLQDEHKMRGGAEAALGFGGVRLPLVLHHNTPNNSISVLWGDTQEVPGSQRFCALFPRYERHHPERP